MIMRFLRRFRLLYCSPSTLVSLILIVILIIKIQERHKHIQVEEESPPQNIISLEDIKLDLINNPVLFPDDPVLFPDDVVPEIQLVEEQKEEQATSFQETNNVDGTTSSTAEDNVGVASSYDGPPPIMKEGLLTILLWNPFFKSEDYYFGLGQQPFIDNQCKVQTCQTTRDHSYLDSAHALALHGPRVDEPMPSRRPPGQLYVYLQAEPHYNGSMTYLPTMGDMFNVTITNRRDSDIYLAYGWVEESPTAFRNRANVFVSPHDRPKSVAGAISHCNTPGRRERYIKELQKHADLDIYGACGTLDCPKSEDCMDMFVRNYKFYLAMENHHCVDYISEKLYKTLEYDIIPIVFGGGNYSLDAPPHSVINIEDFPHPRDLAVYLDYLSNNATAYDEYFEWKKHYVVTHFRHRIFGQAFCDLCELLHNPMHLYKNYTNIASWWIDGMCDPNVVGRMARKYDWFE